MASRAWPATKPLALMPLPGPAGRFSKPSPTGFVASGAYSIADMAIFPWCRLHRRQGKDLDDFPNVRRWFEAMAERPAVAKDMAKLEDKADQKMWDKESWSNLFGAEQYRRR